MVEATLWALGADLPDGCPYRDLVLLDGNDQDMARWTVRIVRVNPRDRGRGPTPDLGATISLKPP